MHDKPIKILVVENNLEDASLIKEFLKEAPHIQTDLVHVQRLSDAQKWLAAEAFDLILLDLFLPDSQGLETMTKMDRKAASLPIVVLTGLQDETIGIEAVRRGAQDYLSKEELNRELLSRVVLYAIERHRLQAVKNDLMAMVSHELRTPLTIVRESIAQVLEGLLGGITEEQRQRLSTALTSTDRLNRMIGNLLDMAKIEAEKLELKKEILNIADMAREVISIFKTRIQSQGLRIIENFPNPDLKVYADKDKIIQVFTNLLSNAIKFTEKGYIEVGVVDKDNFTECSVSDTGLGIGQEYLLKVFDKFQQLGRASGQGEKGTGLGLSICKGLVESHRGRIWVESPPASPITWRAGPPASTRFTFILPHYTPGEIFKECITMGIKESRRQGLVLSILTFEIDDFDTIEKREGKEKMASLLGHLEAITQQSLRRQSDTVIQNSRSILVVLPFTPKNNALLVGARIQHTFEDYLSQESDHPIKILCHAAGYPEDGTTEEQLLKKVREK